MYQRVLVPVDGSAASTLGAAEAIKLAHSEGSKIRFLHVVDEMLVVSPDASGANLGPVVETLRQRGERVLDEAQALARRSGLQSESMVVEALRGQAGSYIIQQALEWPADLIVCGTHGRRGLRRLLLGSDAEYVLRHSPVPVLLVRSREPEAD